MKSSSLPAKIGTPWGASADPEYIRSIPQNSSDPSAASFSSGFPALTFQPTTAGGSPPDGRDVNGILYTVTALIQALSTGSISTFDANFSQQIGGYPKGSIIFSLGPPSRFLISTIDDNQNNPANDPAQTWQDINNDIRQTLSTIEQTLSNKINRAGDTLTGSLYSTGAYPFNGGQATQPIGAQLGNALLYQQLIQDSSGQISGALIFIDANGNAHNLLTASASGHLTSQRGNSFLEVTSSNGTPMRVEAFTTVTDNGFPVTFPTPFSGPPISIIVQALEKDWDCAAALGTWTAQGFTMSYYASNTKASPQTVSVIAVGPA